MCWRAIKMIRVFNFPCPFTHTYFICFLIAATEMTRFDATLCSWNSPAPLAGNTGLCLSRSVSAKQSGWIQNLWTDAGMCVHRTNTCPRYQQLEQRLVDMSKYITERHQRSSWSMKKEVTCMREGKMTSLWTSANLKPALFRVNTLHDRLFFSRQQSVEENTRSK